MRFFCSKKTKRNFARLAQLVERVIDVDDVTGSNPVSRTKDYDSNFLCVIISQLLGLCRGFENLELVF